MVCRALNAAYSGEYELFKRRAHERSIVFHIARHLASEVYQHLPGWSVDVEYDQWHPEHLEDLKKRMLTAAIEAGLAEAGYPPRLPAAADDLSDVYPDIIVHNRAGLSAGHDLLVVEVKKEEAPGYEKAKDRAKLNGFRKKPFSYQYAVFLVLPANGDKPEPEWMT